MKKKSLVTEVTASDTSWSEPVTLTTGHSVIIQRVPDIHWFEIELLDESGDPASGETFRLELPDGTVVLEDQLDSSGRARIDDCRFPACHVTFPLLEGRSWSYAGTGEETSDVRS